MQIDSFWFRRVTVYTRPKTGFTTLFSHCDPSILVLVLFVFVIVENFKAFWRFDTCPVCILKVENVLENKDIWPHIFLIYCTAN